MDVIAIMIAVSPDTAKILAQINAKLDTITAHIHIVGASESLLHFGAVAFLASIAYLGIDRLHEGKNKVHAVATENVAVIAEWLPTLEISIQEDEQGGRKATNPALVNRHAYVLLYVEDIKIENLGIRTLWYCIFRQAFVPGLNYFRKHRHIYWVSVFALLSGAAFAFLVYMEINERALLSQHWVQMSLFYIFLATVFVSFGSSIIHIILNAIMGPQCRRLMKKVAADVEKWKRMMRPPGATTN